MELGWLEITVRLDTSEFAVEVELGCVGWVIVMTVAIPKMAIMIAAIM